MNSSAAAAWLPWCAAAALDLARRAAARRARARRGAPPGLALGLQLLAGEPAISLLTLAFGGVLVARARRSRAPPGPDRAGWRARPSRGRRRRRARASRSPRRCCCPLRAVFPLTYRGQHLYSERAFGAAAVLRVARDRVALPALRRQPRPARRRRQLAALDRAARTSSTSGASRSASSRCCSSRLAALRGDFWNRRSAGARGGRRSSALALLLRLLRCPSIGCSTRSTSLRQAALPDQVLPADDALRRRCSRASRPRRSRGAAPGGREAVVLARRCSPSSRRPGGWPRRAASSTRWAGPLAESIVARSRRVPRGLPRARARRRADRRRSAALVVALAAARAARVARTAATASGSLTLVLALLVGTAALRLGARRGARPAAGAARSGSRGRAGSTSPRPARVRPGRARAPRRRAAAARSSRVARIARRAARAR